MAKLVRYCAGQDAAVKIFSAGPRAMSQPQLHPGHLYHFPNSKHRIDTPERRAALAPRESPYWMTTAYGRALGYKKSPRTGNEWWHARIRLVEGCNKTCALGPVREEGREQPQNGLTYWEAIEAAQHFFDIFAKRAINPTPPALRDIELPKVDRDAPYTVAHAIVDYLKWLGTYSQSTRGRAYSALANIVPPLGHIRLDELKPIDIGEWIQDLAMQPARSRVSRGRVQRYRPMPRNRKESISRKRSVNANLSILKAALNRAYSLGYAESAAAWKGIKNLKVPLQARSRYLTREEIRRLLDVLPNDLGDLVRGALHTGCRAGELMTLRVQQFLKDPGKLILHETKVGRNTAPTLTPEGVAFFKRLTEGRKPTELVFLRSDGRPWSYYGYQRGMTLASKAAEIEPRVNFHELRHTYASHALMSGIPIVVVARQLGHVDTKMVERYYGHIAQSYVDQEIRDKMPSLF